MKVTIKKKDTTKKEKELTKALKERRSKTASKTKIKVTRKK